MGYGANMEERRYDSLKLLEFMAVSGEKLETIHSDIIELKQRVAIQNGRIFKLEKWQSFVFGACAVLGVVTTLFGIIPLWIKH